MGNFCLGAPTGYVNTSPDRHHNLDHSLKLSLPNHVFLLFLVRSTFKSGGFLYLIASSLLFYSFALIYIKALVLLIPSQCLLLRESSQHVSSTNSLPNSLTISHPHTQRKCLFTSFTGVLLPTVLQAY